MPNRDSRLCGAPVIGRCVTSPTGTLPTMESETDLVRLDRPDDGITVVSLWRPSRLNAMSIDLMSELYETFGAIAADNTCRVVILTGSNRAFCSGLDLKDYGVVPNIDGLAMGRIAQRSMRHYSRIVPLMRSLPQPIIAAIDGAAYGGGFCLALGADLRFATRDAVFNATGIVNGLSSAEMGISWLLPRLIGAAHSTDILLTGRKVDASQAHDMGLVSRVFDDADGLMEAALETARVMCGYSAYGVAMTKEVVRASLEVASLDAAIELEDRNQLMMGFTENLPEAIRSFAQGRVPRYTDEPRRDLFG